MKILKRVIIVLFIVIAYIIGFHQGERNVIYNQTIYGENQESGTYFSEYKGQINEYYYEK